jgi:hypothetical protein
LYEGKTNLYYDLDGRIKRGAEGHQTWWICFVSVYENKTMEPIEIFLRRKDGG